MVLYDLNGMDCNHQALKFAIINDNMKTVKCLYSDKMSGADLKKIIKLAEDCGMVTIFTLIKTNPMYIYIRFVLLIFYFFGFY